MTRDLRAPQCDDELTHTSLHIEEPLSQNAEAQITSALRHVPGVLTAEFDASGTTAAIAHDPGVPDFALLQAATSGGARFTIVHPTPTEVAHGLISSKSNYGEVFLLVSTLLVATAFFDWKVLPRQHEIALVLISSLWVVCFAIIAERLRK